MSGDFNNPPDTTVRPGARLRDILIPAPYFDPERSQGPRQLSSLQKAVDEATGFEDDRLERRMRHTERWATLYLRLALFLAVLALNIWWDHNVLRLIWRSGEQKEAFHLADSVLIALVTTSVANFLALVAIMARNLFRGQARRGVQSRTNNPACLPLCPRCYETSEGTLRVHLTHPAAEMENGLGRVCRGCKWFFLEGPERPRSTTRTRLRRPVNRST